MDQGATPTGEPADRGNERSTEPTGPRQGRSGALGANWPVTAIIVGGALAAALSGASPVGSNAFDAIWCALAGAFVAWAASRADPLAVTWMAAIAAVVGVGGGWLAAGCGLLALASAVYGAWDRHPLREMAALSGALGIQALLRGPSYGFLGLPTLVVVLAVAPMVLSGFRRAPGGEQRVVRISVLAVAAFVLVASVGAGIAALLARGDLTSSGNDAETALGYLRDGELEQAVPTLDAATQGFSSSAGLLNGPLAFAGRAVPIVGQHVEALRRVASAGEHLTATAAVAANSADYQKLKADNGRVDIAELRSMAGPVRASADAIVATQRLVSDVSSPWLVGAVHDQLRRLSVELADAAPAATDAADALAIAPTLLGGDGEQRYLLMFATPGESRGAGGFVGTYGVLSAVDGQLDLGATGSTQELGPELVDPTSGGGYSFIPPPGWDDLYGRYNVQFFPGNVSASPDWPTDSEVARQVYAQVPGVGDTQGVLYADPAALAAFLELTGPVDVPGVDQPLDSQNVEQFLYVDQYVTFSEDRGVRRDVLGQVAEAVFGAFTTRPLPPLGELTAALGPVVSSGHLKFVSFDAGAEALFTRTGLAGAWSTSPGADWLSLRSTNMLPNKIDWFLRRSMSVDTTIDPRSRALYSTVTVTLRNEAPPSGLPAYLIGNVNGLPDGSNKDALALYTPHRLDSVEVDGVAAGVQRQQGYGGNIYTVPVVVPPQGTATVVYRISGTAPVGRAYVLDLLHQPLAHEDQVSVSIGSVNSDLRTSLYNGPLSQNVELAAIGS